MNDKGHCPRCGGEMIWQRVKVNGLRFLLYDGNSDKFAWKCSQCGVEIGGTYHPRDRTPPPQEVKLPHECIAYKRFRILYHTSKLLITSQGLQFTDPKDSTYSFSLNAVQLKQAKIEPCNFIGDILVVLPNGTKYDIGLDDEKQEMVLAAIRLVCK